MYQILLCIKYICAFLCNSEILQYQQIIHVLYLLKLIILGINSILLGMKAYLNHAYLQLGVREYLLSLTIFYAVSDQGCNYLPI